MFALWPFLLPYTKYTNIYVNFIVLLCRLTVDFIDVRRYNKGTIKQGGSNNDGSIQRQSFHFYS